MQVARSGIYVRERVIRARIDVSIPKETRARARRRSNRRAVSLYVVALHVILFHRARPRINYPHRICPRANCPVLLRSHFLKLRNVGEVVTYSHGENTRWCRRILKTRSVSTSRLNRPFVRLVCAIYILESKVCCYRKKPILHMCSLAGYL